MRRRLWWAWFLGCVLALPAVAQNNGWAEVANSWGEIQVSSGGGSGTVTTTGSPASGQVAVMSGAGSITGFTGFTFDGTNVLCPACDLSAASVTTEALVLGTGVVVQYGAGDPEGAAAGGRGSLYHRTSNGAIYHKTTSTGNTGWVLLPDANASPVAAGSDTQVTFNDGGTPAGSAKFVFDKTTGRVTITAASNAGLVAALRILSAAGSGSIQVLDNSTFVIDGDGGTGATLQTWKSGGVTVASMSYQGTLTANAGLVSALINVGGGYSILYGAASNPGLFFYDNTNVSKVVDGVVGAGTGAAGSTAGWFMDAGTARVTNDVTNATATMANVTGLSRTLKAGRAYSGRLVLYVADSVAGEGVKVDFDGGTATMTSFRSHCTVHDSALLLSTQTSAIATDIAVATATGDTLIDCRFALVVNGAGTFNVRAAQNSHSTGTLTTYATSYLDMRDTQ